MLVYDEKLVMKIAFIYRLSFDGEKREKKVMGGVNVKIGDGISQKIGILALLI